MTTDGMPRPAPRRGYWGRSRASGGHHAPQGKGRSLALPRPRRIGRETQAGRAPVDHSSRGVGPLQGRYSGLAAPDGLRVVAEGHDGAGVPGDLGDEPDLDALRLHRRDERVPSRVRRDVGKAEALERRLPIPLPKVLVEDRTTAAGPRLRPRLKAAGPGKTRWSSLPFRGQRTRQASSISRSTAPIGTSRVPASVLVISVSEPSRSWMRRIRTTLRSKSTSRQSRPSCSLGRVPARKGKA
jgi:hypothetical protein